MRVWFRVVNADGTKFNRINLSNVMLDASSTFFDFRQAAYESCRRAIPFEPCRLTLYKSLSAFEEDQPLDLRTSVANLTEEDTVIVAVPNFNLTIADIIAAEEVEYQELLQLCQWNEPERLCTGPGRDWPYQGRWEVVSELVDALVMHYDAWQENVGDFSCHPLNLVLGGAGTGKSRMLDEMKELLCEAAHRSERPGLAKSLKKAYVFKLTFDADGEVNGPLLDTRSADFDISRRMLHQLAKRRQAWLVFASQMKKKRPRVETVIEILAELEKVAMKDMTVILCVDNLERLEFERNQVSDLSRVMAAICNVQKSSKAFVVCACAATCNLRIHQVIERFTQARVVLQPPQLSGVKILEPQEPWKLQLVEDMGGHGRALEALQEVFRRHEKDGSLANIDAIKAFTEVCTSIRSRYGAVFISPLFTDAVTCQQVLITIFSRGRYSRYQRISDMAVDDLDSCGLIRLTREGRLDCACILLHMLIEKHVDNIGGNADFREKLTRFMVDRQSFEEFVEFFRRVKSAVYYDTLVNISTFHTGARFDSLNEILIQEPKDDIGVAGSSASANGICSKVELTIDGNQVLCNEVIQVLRTEKKLTNAAYALEREKAVNDNSDVFLLITRRPVTKNFLLPDRCGVVSQSEFEHYFGPFASRAYRSFRGPPGKQTKTTK